MSFALQSQPVYETNPSSARVTLRRLRAVWPSRCSPLQPARLGRGGGALGSPREAGGLWPPPGRDEGLPGLPPLPRPPPAPVRVAARGRRSRHPPSDTAHRHAFNKASPPAATSTPRATFQAGCGGYSRLASTAHLVVQWLEPQVGFTQKPVQLLVVEVGHTDGLHQPRVHQVLHGLAGTRTTCGMAVHTTDHRRRALPRTALRSWLCPTFEDVHLDVS